MNDRSSYYGIASLLFAFISVIFLGVYFAVSQLNISPQLFNEWNRTSLSISCIFAPMTWAMGYLGWQGSNTSKILSSFSILMVGAPFLILFGQFVYYLIPK
jgi:hypothetical protein